MWTSSCSGVAAAPSDWGVGSGALQPRLTDTRSMPFFFFAYYFEVSSRRCEESYTYGSPSPTQSISVSEGKVMGLWGKGGGGVWRGLGQSKQWRSQHSKQTLPHVWTTHLEPYSSPTHSRSPLAVLFLLTPHFFFPFFFFLAGPVKYTAYPRTCP